MKPELLEFVQTHVTLGSDAPTFGQQLMTQFGGQKATAPAGVAPRAMSAQSSLAPYEFAQAFKAFPFPPEQTSPQLYVNYQLDAPTMAQTLVDVWHDTPPDPSQDLTATQVLVSLQAVNVAQGTDVYSNDEINAGLAAVNYVAGVYVRDKFGDTGAVPTSGQLWISPDIIPMQARVNNPIAQFGPPNWDTRFGQNIEAGQDNYIYIRMFNRGTMADNPTINLFWVVAQTNINVSDWVPVGTATTPLIQAGDYYVTEEPIVLPKENIPAGGHYCFICYLNSPRNPVTIPNDLGSVFSQQYNDFMSGHNQACWRNVNIVNAKPDQRAARGMMMIGGEPTQAPPLKANYTVTMRAWPKTDATYGLKVMTSLPSSAIVNIFDGKRTRSVNILPDGEWSILGEDIEMQADEKREVSVDVTIPSDLRGREYLMSIAQFDENITMGCVSYIIQT